MLLSKLELLESRHRRKLHKHIKEAESNGLFKSLLLSKPLRKTKISGDSNRKHLVCLQTHKHLTDKPSEKTAQNFQPKPTISIKYQNVLYQREVLMEQEVKPQ